MDRIQVMRPEKDTNKRRELNNSPWLRGGKAVRSAPDLLTASTSSGIAEVQRNPMTRTMASAGFYQDLGARYTIRRIALLFEHNRFEECKSLIQQLDHEKLPTVLHELPLDNIIQAIPHSLGMVEALYSKVFTADAESFPTAQLKPEQVVVYIVKWLSTVENNPSTEQKASLSNHLPRCKTILRIIAYVRPRLKAKLLKRKKMLIACIETLGSHGLVDTSDSKLMNLHNAMKIEFGKTVQHYKAAMQKLEDLSLTNKNAGPGSFTKGPAPTGASHQRLLQVTQSEIQERLIKNKTLLNLVEPAVTNVHLARQLLALERRIQSDKQVLFNFTELRKEMQDLPSNPFVAPVFQQFANGYSQVLDLLREVTGDRQVEEVDDSVEDDVFLMNPYQRLLGIISSVSSVGSTQSSSSSGQQSRDPQSRQLLPANSKPSLTGSMTGLPSDTTSQSVLAQSPQGQGGTAVNGTANGKPGLCQAPISTAGSVPERRELETLRTEVKMLRKELAKSKEMISKLQDREKMLRDRLSEQAQKQLEKSAKFEDLSMGDSRPTALIRRYGNLYSQTRVDAFDALDMLPEMADFDDLKAKLLFSIVVLSFRSVKQKLSDMHGKFYHMLDVPQPEGREASSLDPVVQDLEETIGIYLRKNVDKFDVTALVEDVRTQLLATLYDYPSLKTCEGLHVYIEECVRLAWALSVQKPSYVIDYEAKIYDPHMHMRFHSSDPESLEIQNVLWPALLEGENGPCVQKGVVLT